MISLIPKVNYLTKKKCILRYIRLPFLFYLFILTVLLSACEQEKTPQKRSPKPLATVEIAHAQIIPLNHTIHLVGTLKAKRTIHFYNQTAGRLIKLPFYEGDSIHKGDLLGQLDNTIIKAQYNKAQATLKQAKMDYQRLEKLAKNKLTSEELLARAKTKVSLDQSEYTLQKKRLSYTQIHAPWDGVISERLVELGDVLPLHTHFLSLMDTSNLIVQVSLSELYLSQVQLGDSVAYQIDALGGKVWQGEISRIHPQINAQTRKGVIEIKLKHAPDNARPGQLTRITLQTKKEPVLVIPLSAVRYDQQGAYVFIVQAEKKIARVTIKTGKKYPSKIEVLDGLKVGDTIVKKGLFGLRSGKKVTIINP